MESALRELNLKDEGCDQDDICHVIVVIEECSGMVLTPRLVVQVQLPCNSR